MYTLTYEDILNDWQLSFNYVQRTEKLKLPHSKLYRDACKKWDFYKWLNISSYVSYRLSPCYLALNSTISYPYTFAVKKPHAVRAVETP